MNNDTRENTEVFMLLTCTRCLLLYMTIRVIPIPHVMPSSSPAMNTPTAISTCGLLTVPGGEKIKIKECLPHGGRDRFLSQSRGKVKCANKHVGNSL